MNETAKRHWKEAARQARVCHLLLDELPRTEPVDAVSPLLRGWFCAGQAWAATAGDDWQQVPDRCAYLEQHLLGLLEDADSAPFRATFDRLEAIHRAPERATVLDDADARDMLHELERLERVLRSLEPRALGAPWHARRGVRIGVGVGSAVLVAAVAWVILGGAARPWSIAYYNSPEMTGLEIHDREPSLQLHWGHDRSPFGSGPFSAVARSCLSLDEARELRFELGSDDGSRLYVDDELLIDNWGRHEHRVKRARRRFDPGTYALRVEYVQAGASASLELEMGEQGEPLEPAGAPLLSRPVRGRCEGR